MRRKARIWLGVLFALLASVSVKAAGGDTVVLRLRQSAVTFDIGHTRNHDTYLSILPYSGRHMRLGYEFMRASRRHPLQWVHQVNAGFSYDSPVNPAGNNKMHTVLADIDWGMMRRWNNVFVDGLNLYAGGNLAFEGGCTYNPRNSNNVASPHIYLNAGLTGMAVYRFKVGRLPVTARYQPTIPVVGAYYLPEYDQSFYEIYLGNYWNTATFGWWGNRFDMENLLTFDWHFGSTALRIGYRHNFTTLWAKNISVRKSVHSLVLGVEWESLRIHPVKGLLAKAKMISAMY